ncbi:HAD-IIIA family hydrolase, partial [Bacillus cereus]
AYGLIIYPWQRYASFSLEQSTKSPQKACNFRQGYASFSGNFMGKVTLLEIHKHMQEKLINENAAALIHEFVACIHRPKDECSCRKPEAGMLLQLAQKYDIDLANSYMIGDQETDISAGKKAGTKTIRIANDLEETHADMRFSSLLNIACENII